MITRRAMLGLGGASALALTARAVTRATAPARAESAGGERAARPRVRWAMAIDVTRCREAAGCDDCVRACHRVHNVPDVPDPRHRVRWIGRERFARVFPDAAAWTDEGRRGRPVPVLCNHCDTPACVSVCPTRATWKRDDGIVAMDWHRCIGCKYCIVACPYGARSFNFVEPRPYVTAVDPGFPTRVHGVVEKCTFCAERLDAGRRPACVEACGERAMVFGDLADPASPVRALLRRRHALRRKPELGTGPAVFYVV